MWRSEVTSWSQLFPSTFTWVLRPNLGNLTCPVSTLTFRAIVLPLICLLTISMLSFDNFIFPFTDWVILFIYFIYLFIYFIRCLFFSVLCSLCSLDINPLSGAKVTKFSYWLSSAELMFPFLCTCLRFMRFCECADCRPYFLDYPTPH